MGEKRAYKARKPGGGRKKLKPEYDAGKNLKDQMDAAVALYEEDCSLQSIADVLNLNPIKVRKLLITAGVYESEVAEKVQDTFERYRKTQDYKTSILSTLSPSAPHCLRRMQGDAAHRPPGGSHASAGFPQRKSPALCIH